MLFSRITYETFAASFFCRRGGMADQMNNFPKVVVSSTLDEATWQHSTLIKDNVVEEITKLKQQPGRNINISGSATLVAWLLRQGLLDELDLLLFPVVVGHGKHLFEQDGDQVLTLAESNTFSNGVLNLTIAGRDAGDHLARARYRQLGNQRQGFIHRDTHAGVGGFLLGLSQGLIAALLLAGALLLWRRRPRGLVASIWGAMLVVSVAWQAAEASDVVVAAVLVALSVVLIACLITRSANRALGVRRRGGRLTVRNKPGYGSRSGARVAHPRSVKSEAAEPRQHSVARAMKRPAEVRSRACKRSPR